MVDRYLAAVRQGARPADPFRRRAYLAQPRGAGRAAARSPAAQAMLRGARPRPAEAAHRRHRPHHADAALLPHSATARWRASTAPAPPPTDALATVLAYDDIEGAPVRAATNSGYVRLELRDDAAHLATSARPLRSRSARTAHAGFLSFEMSSGNLPDDRQLRNALGRPRRLDIRSPARRRRIRR